MKPASFSFRSTNNVLFIGLLFLLFGQQTFSQFSCDSIQLGTIQYTATDANVIEVQAMTVSGDCVNYPSFILFDQNGDTLAKESVNFFCIGIGNFSSHGLNIHAGANIPLGPFYATLELFSGFGDTLVCSWNLTLDLCPADSCILGEIYLTNLDTLEAGNVYWEIYNNNGTFGSGIITMDLISHTHFDTVCLPPGNYELYLSPFSDIWIDDSYVLGITQSYNSSIGTNTAQQGDPTPESLQFHWFEECIDGTNAIEEHDVFTSQVFQANGSLSIISIDNSPLGEIDLIDLQGRAVSKAHTRSSSFQMNITSLSTGLYIIRHRSPNHKFSVQRIFIH